MKILHIAQARLLLWAWDRHGGEAFEVSKVVNHPLQASCPSAPACPQPRGALELDRSSRPVWIDPTEPPTCSCPYEFERRGECLRLRNQLALEEALFRPSELSLTRRLLESLGYQVTNEPIDPASQPNRILKAHSFLGSSHQVRLHHSPAAGPIVLVRQAVVEAPRLPARASRRPRSRARPVGGNQ